MASGEAYEREVRASLLYKAEEEKGLLWFKKLVDTHAVQGYAGKAAMFSESANWGFANMLAPRVPSDYLLVYRYRPIFIECKSSRCKTSYDFIKYVKDHQASTAKDINKAGGMYYFMFCNRAERGDKSKTYILRGEKVYWLRQQLLANKKRSKKWEEIEEMALYTITKDLMKKDSHGKPLNPWPLDWLDQEIDKWQKEPLRER